jgi:uncharacterized protein YndB with AHSA1/START domain
VIRCALVAWFVVAASLAADPLRAGEAVEFPVRGITLEKEVPIAAPPDEAWNAFTGDVSGWWDHTFSGKPRKLVIDRLPGGGFWEIFDAEGHGVKHAEILWAEPGKVLKMRGPLGFSGKAVDLVHTFRFEPDGAGTKILFTLNALGQLDDLDVAALEQVWEHFLVERFQAHVAAGKHRP